VILLKKYSKVIIFYNSFFFYFLAGIVWGQVKNLANPNLAGAHLLEAAKKEE